MSRRRHLIVLAAGGTGGHVFPAEALAAELAANDYRLALVTDRRGHAYGSALSKIDTYHIRAGGIAGKTVAGRLRGVFELAIGVFQARSLMKRLAPAMVIGFGGYASAPTVLAASMGGFATAIHEQNAVLGRANRLLAPRVERIAASFEKMDGLSAEALKKVLLTGMPVRPSVAAARANSYPKIKKDGPFHILVLGGSQGARILSQVVPFAIAHLPERLRGLIRITQQCRPEDLEATRKAYDTANIDAKLKTFFNDIPEQLAGAHLLIGRAGASTVAETMVVGRPSILVPYPHAADGHQSANAHAVDEMGAGWLMPQSAFTPQTLSARLEALLTLPQTLEKAAAAARSIGRPDAAARLAEMVTRMLPPNVRQKDMGDAP